MSDKIKTNTLKDVYNSRLRPEAFFKSLYGQVKTFQKTMYIEYTVLAKLSRFIFFLKNNFEFL